MTIRYLFHDGLFHQWGWWAAAPAIAWFDQIIKLLVQNHEHQPLIVSKKDDCIVKIV